MMMRREYPELLPEALRPQARRLAALVRDPSEFLWAIRNEPRFNTAFKSTPGGAVAYHAPCHLRAQGVGFKGRDLLRKIPGVVPKMTMECCGHDGTYAMKVEGFEQLDQGRPEGLRRHEGGRRRGLGDRLPARRAAVPAARGPQAAAPDVDPGPRLPRGRLREEGRGAGRRGRGGAEGRRGAMKTVERSEILDYATYEERRAAIRDAAMQAKDERRVHVGRYLTFLFENRETIRYQIQEMMRAERMVREADIAHEIETYNELLGGGGELGCTLLIEIDDPAERAVKLGRWLGLPAAALREARGRDEGPRAVRRASGRRRAALLGAVPEVPGRWPRPGRRSAATSTTPMSAARRRFRPPSGPPWRRTCPVSRIPFRIRTCALAAARSEREKQESDSRGREMLSDVTDRTEDGSADPGPLFRALRDAAEHERSGRLQLVSARELRQLRFLEGAIADASSDVPGERLGDVLVRHGLLSQADLDGAVEVVLRERKRLGPVLAEKGLLDEVRIREAIGLHVREIVSAALGRAGLKVAFEELPEDEVETDFECPLSPAQLILDASRRVGLEHVTRAIAADGRVLVVTTDERSRAARGVTLTPADGFILSQVDGTLRAADLAGVVPLPREEFERSLFGLISIGLVGFMEPRAPAPPRARRKPAPASDAVPPAPPPAGSRAPTAPTSPPAPPPTAPSADAPTAQASTTPPAGSPAPARPAPRSSQELRQCILEAHRGLERTHYEVLGIGQDASGAEVRGAYARLMRTFHPDALRGPGLDDVEAQREAVCLRAGEAYEVLRNDEARAAYDNNLKLWRRKVPAPPPLPPAPASAPPPAAVPSAASPSPSRASAPAAPAVPVDAGAAAAPAGGSAPTAAPATHAGPAGAHAGAAASPAATPTAEARAADDAEAQIAAIAAAETLVEDGEFWDAIQKLEPLLPRLSGSRRARARMALAEAYARNPKWRRRAEEALRLAIEDSPRDTEPRLRLASLYVELGLPARAAALCRAVLEIDPRNAAAREALGDGHEAPAGSAIKKLLNRR